MRAPSIAAVLLFSFTSFSPADVGPIEDRLQRVLDEGIREYEARGVSAAVILPDRTVCDRHPKIGPLRVRVLGLFLPE
jgi:hypothetical protein